MSTSWWKPPNSQYYNRRHTKTGHVFQGRYQAILAIARRTFWSWSGTCTSIPPGFEPRSAPVTYRWSRHGGYLGRSSPVTVTTTTVLEAFHRQVGPARQAYQRFLMEAIPHGHQARFYDTIDQQMLGDEQFIEAVTHRTARGERATHPRRVAFGTLVNAVAQVSGVTTRSLLGPGRQRRWVPARSLLVYLAREWGSLSAQQLGRQLHPDPSMISHLATAYGTHRHIKIEAGIRQAIQAHSTEAVRASRSNSLEKPAEP